MEQIIAAIIGGFLAAVAGWFIQNRIEARRIDRTRTLITTAIEDDLKHSKNLYEKIQEDWERTRTIWFSTLNEFRESRQIYQNNKDWIILFDDSELRHDLFKYYLKSADLINNMEYQQKRKYELHDKLNEMIRKIQFDEPTLSRDDATARAVSYMQDEDAEHRRLDGNLEEAMRKIETFKSEAQRLLSRLPIS